MVFCELRDEAQANLQDDDRDVANETSLPYQTVGKNSTRETSSWPATEYRHMKSLLNWRLTQLYLAQTPDPQNHGLIKWYRSKTPEF